MTVLALLFTGCVTEDIPRDYAKRAHPDCESFRVINHQTANTAQTEISMQCPVEGSEPTRRSITIKCIFGFGILADTTCHENN